MNVPVRIQTGVTVRIDGQEFQAGPVISGGRVFFDKSGGTQKFLSEVAQLRMARDWRLTANELPDAVRKHVAQALTIDWGSFTPAERELAIRKAYYVRKIDALPPLDRVKKKVIVKVIAEVAAEHRFPVDKLPKPRSVRRWYRHFIAAGRDVRALVDFHYAKGNHDDRYADWLMEEVQKAISEFLITDTPASFRAVWKQANLNIRARAAKESEDAEKHKRGKLNLIGRNLIAKLFRKHEQYEVLVAQVGQREADRLLACVELGPQGDEVNSEWEVDHTLLDIFVIDPMSGKAAARPWMTTILDRYSRCIVGFSLSFAPPSWTAIMDALRVSIRRKHRILAALGGINNTWDCFGIPKFLICDKGRDFMSKSLKATGAALGFKIVHMKPKKPWLKGKIERWFRTLEEEIIHLMPGTTFSHPGQRKFYDSEGCAVLTIEETNWIVAKWIVDVYHQREHTKLHRSPADMWTAGLRAVDVPPAEIPASLLKPLMGLVLPRTIRRTGVTYLGLRWDSHGFSTLRNRLARSKGSAHEREDVSSDVMVRNRSGGSDQGLRIGRINEAWVVGHLKEPVEAKGYTLDQWLFVNAERKRRYARRDRARDGARTGDARHQGLCRRDRKTEKRIGRAEAPDRIQVARPFPHGTR